MKMNDYQRQATGFAVYPAEHKVTYPTLGMCGEAGEVANLANDIGYNLEEIAVMNIEKLTDRKHRDKIKGNGDNR